MDIRNTKIYFGNDAVLGEQIFKKLKELGVDPKNHWKYWNDNGGKEDLTCFFIYEDLELSWSDGTKSGYFSTEKSREITTKDLGMEKKQIGWKFKTPEFKNAAEKLISCIKWNMVGKDFEQHSSVEDHLKSLGVLELWCDAVYEKETFQEHDWVYITSGNFGWVKQGDVVQLGGKYWKKYGVRKQGGEQHISAITPEYPDGNYGRGNITFRKATAEEIKNAQIIKIGIYTVEVVSNNEVYIGGYSYSFIDVTRVLEVLSLNKVKSINVGCDGQLTLTKHTAEQILKAMKNAKL